MSGFLLSRESINLTLTKYQGSSSQVNVVERRYLSRYWGKIATCNYYSQLYPVLKTLIPAIVMSTLLFLAPISSPAVAGVEFEVCYDFGCRNSSKVSLSDEEWRSVVSLFDVEDAIGERENIKRAIARMETLAGRYSPVHRDVGMNLPVVVEHETGKKERTPTASASLFPGQLDCIDESLNTTRYLVLFEQAGLLRFHQVGKRVYRRSILNQHWAAQVIDTTTTTSSKRYVIDSWFEDNGEQPVLVSSERWHDLSL